MLLAGLVLGLLAQNPVLEIELTDLARPQVVPIARASRVQFKHPGAPRPLTVAGFGCGVTGVALPVSTDPEGFTTPLYVIPWRNTAGPMALVVVAENTVDAPPLIMAAPPSGRTLAERDLSQATLTFFRTHSDGPWPEQDLALLWATIPTPWFVFSSPGKCDGTAGPINEPLLVESIGADTRVTLRRINGTRMECAAPAFKGVTTETPTVLRFSAPVARFAEVEPLFDDEHFLARRPTDRSIAAYVVKKARTRACAEKLSKTLDPDGRAAHFDLATRDRKEEDLRVTAFDRVIARKIDSKCGLTALNAERESIFARLLAEDLAAQRRATEALAKRLGLPIDPQPEKRSE